MASEALPAPGVVSPGRWTDEDLWALSDDGNRYEIIDGELLVTPAPAPRHQLVSGEFYAPLRLHARAHGGVVAYAPLDVRFTGSRVVEPDLLYLRAENRHRLTGARCEGPPDLVVEISSPSTRARDRLAKRALYESEGVLEYWFADLDNRLAKRALYESEGVLEYWFVDLDNDVIEVYRHDGVRYSPPVRLGLDDELTSPLLPGFVASVRDLLVQH